MFSRAIREQGVPQALPVAAVLAAGLALLSLFLTPSPAPAAADSLPVPAGLSASMENGRMRLRWAAAGSAVGYAVYCSTRSGDEGAFSLLSLAPGTSTALVPLIQPGLVQYCQLRATRGHEASAPSAEVHAPQLEAPWQEMRLE